MNDKKFSNYLINYYKIKEYLGIGPNPQSPSQILILLYINIF